MLKTFMKKSLIKYNGVMIYIDCDNDDYFCLIEMDVNVLHFYNALIILMMSYFFLTWGDTTTDIAWPSLMGAKYSRY